MAGLLDFTQTPEGMQGLALLAAAAPSMEPTNFAGRLALAGNTYRGLLDNQLKSKFIQSQIDENTSQADTRRAALAKQQQLLALFGGAPGASSAVPAAPGQLGSGSFGIQPPPAGLPSIPQGAGAQPAGSRIGSMTPDQLVQAKLLGVDLADVYKLAQPDWQVSNGYAFDKNDKNFKGGFLPGVNIANDGRGTMTLPGPNGLPTMSALPGSVSAFGEFEDRKNQSAARADLVKVVGPDGAERYVPKATVLGSAPSAAPAGKTPFTMPGDADRKAILSQEMTQAQQRLAAATTPEERNRAATDIEALKREIGPAGGFQATPTNAQSLSKDATGKLNESFIKSRYEPTLAAGDAANDMLTNVNVARQSLRSMGGTGWGTENKAAAASVLAGLGIASPNAKMYASNAETFQNVAMQNLKTVLDAAKGPQTEGDADRASKTFAQLKNTPQANEFILDLAEAKAAREQMKARFFQQALPIAQQKGDLQEVEREWAKRSPSVFSMPSMQRWGVKK